MPPRKRKVMPLGDSSNRIRPRTPDARVERSADKSASLKSTTGIIENDEIARPAHNRAVVALPEETVKSEQHTPSSFISQAATAIESPSPMKPAGETTGCVTTTPPRPPQQPPTVVETCPTPPSSSSAAPTPSRRARRRPLLDAHVDGRIVGDEAVLPSSSSSSLPLEIRTPGLFETAEQVNPTTMAAANADVARKGSLDLPNGWRQTDPTFARLPRRTPRHSTDTTTSTPPLPDLNPANLISALLAQSLPVSGPRRNSGDLPRSAATSLRSERHQTEKSRSLRSGRATPVSTGAGLSPPPLENRSRPVSPRSPPPPPLRPQPSTTTLFSWDLAHLPAPDAPREKPYRVSWKSVLLPTRYLGGGRGSGRYGDQWGPVERKGAARSSLAAAALEGARSHHAGGEKEDETVRSNRRWNGRRSSSPSSAAAAATAAARASSSAPSCSPTSGRLGVDSTASLASRGPERTPSEKTRRRPHSILRRLSRSSVASWAAASSNSTTTADRQPATISRRQSLVASLFGAKSTASKRSGEDEEDLHQWVSVVLK